MKAVISQKETTCHFCKKTIPAKTERLTDVIHWKSGGKLLAQRKHFHFNREKDRRSCYDEYAESIFNKMPEEEWHRKSNNPSGRPPLDITPEQRDKRRKLIRSLYNQINYYVYQGKLDLSTPHMLTEIDLKSVRKAERFNKNIRRILQGLADCGGVPSKYQHIADSILERPEVPLTEAEKHERFENVARFAEVYSEDHQ